MLGCCSQPMLLSERWSLITCQSRPGRSWSRCIDRLVWSWNMTLQSDTGWVGMWWASIFVFVVCMMFRWLFQIVWVKSLCYREFAFQDRRKTGRSLGNGFWSLGCGASCKSNQSMCSCAVSCLGCLIIFFLEWRRVGGCGLRVTAGFWVREAWNESKQRVNEHTTERSNESKTGRSAKRL